MCRCHSLHPVSLFSSPLFVCLSVCLSLPPRFSKDQRKKIKQASSTQQSCHAFPFSLHQKRKCATYYYRWSPTDFGYAFWMIKAFQAGKHNTTEYIKGKLSFLVQYNFSFFFVQFYTWSWYTWVSTGFRFDKSVFKYWWGKCVCVHRAKTVCSARALSSPFQRPKDRISHQGRKH